MSTTLYDYFREQTADSSVRGRYISIFACLQPPLELRLNIHSFGDKRNTISKEQTDDWIRAQGLDAFLDFWLVGYVSYPEPFINQAVKVEVNPLSSLRRYALSSEGLIGEGFYDGTRFEISLYFPLDVTKELLDYVQARGHRQQPSKPLGELLRLCKDRTGWQGEEHRLDLIRMFQDGITGFDPALANLRFDLCDVKLGDWLAQGKTMYNVCRLYG